MLFLERRLANGLQVIAEQNPHVHSVAVGFFVRTGSRDETAEVSGVSHFLEHMAFKGTARHSAEDVNRVFDEVGAKYNASTSEETTLFYGAVLPEYLPRMFDLLADIIFPALREEDFLMEKKVILEEIGMYDDQPGYLVYERAMQSHFRNHPLGNSVLGTVDSITALQVDQMRAYHQQRYQAGNIILAAAGNFDWEELQRLIEKSCAHWPAGSPPRALWDCRGTPGQDLLVRSTNTQQHVMQMWPGPESRSNARFAAELMSVIVGDDTGSRLFWELVDPGFAESADLGYSDFDGAGAFMSYLSCSPEETADNLQRMQSILDAVNRDGVTQEELEQACSKVLSRIVLRGERPMGRLSSLGNNWLYRQEYRPVSKDLADYRAVTIHDIRRLLDEFPLLPVTTATVGPLEQLAVPVAEAIAKS